MSDPVLEYETAYAASDWKSVWHPVQLGKVVEINKLEWVVTGITRRPGGKVYIARFNTTAQVNPEDLGMRWHCPGKAKKKHAHA